MSSKRRPTDRVPPNRERALAMVLAAIIAALAIAGVLLIVT